MSRYQLRFKQSAAKELAKLPAQVVQTLLPAIEALADDPRPQGSKKLKGYASTYRIRQGDYRVLYQIADQLLIIEVQAVRHRREAYE